MRIPGLVLATLVLAALVPLTLPACGPGGGSCEDHCANRRQDCGETGLDCGGACASCADPCADHCDSGAQDCGEEGVDCGAGCDACADPCTGHCTNGAQDCGEEGVDCGGACGSCADPCMNHCTDGLLDCGETGLDCGGACLSCTDPCAAHCGNGGQDCGETGVDCGGECAACGDPCDGHCTSGAQDCGETGVDCGGGCLSCTDPCAAHCGNGALDCGEAGVDCGGECAPCAALLIEAETFANRGGWSVDSQFGELMGSPYLIAHGKGVPVAAATHSVTFPRAGTYRMWVRTKDWVPPYRPGTFRVAVGGAAAPASFGALATGWGWEDGGPVVVGASATTVELRDETGFDGRCDALLFTEDQSFVPPSAADELRAFRRRMLGRTDPPAAGGNFDLIVVGGGIAGTSATLAAARLGLRVALIHDRTVLGGNASQEVRIHTCGHKGEGFARAIVDALDWDLYCTEIDAGASESIGYDAARRAVLDAEPNATLLMPWRATGVVMSGSRITAVDAVHTTTGEERRYTAPLFVDATGDGWIGYWAGASYRTGRESLDELQESLAPPAADNVKLGSTIYWSSVDTGSAQTFPDVAAWTRDVVPADFHADHGDWTWEVGIQPNLSTIDDAEAIRDHLLRAIYGAFHNEWLLRPTLRLDWVGYVAGKRESRRLEGDLLLREQDIRERVAFPDTVVIGSWPIDLHFPRACRPCTCDCGAAGCAAACTNACDACVPPGPGGPEFLSYCTQTRVPTYGIPYRALYSRDVDNLFMAGRDISVSHVALGGTRVMNTGGQMGAAVAVAAHLCLLHATTPRGVYAGHLDELVLGVTGLHRPLGPLVRVGYVQSDGARSWAQTCDVSGAGAQDCTLADHPFVAEALPPAGVTPDPGTTVWDRYAFVYRADGARVLRDGYVQSDGVRSWSRTCDLDAAGTISNCGAFSAYAHGAQPPADPGESFNARYAFVYSAAGAQKLRNGYVQANGAKSCSQTCDISPAGVQDCDVATHPFQCYPLPPAGIAPDPGRTISDRYAFVYVVEGAQKLRNGFIQSDGAKAWSQTCDISAAGAQDCDPATHPFQQWTLPPAGVSPAPGTAASHRFEYAIDPY